jgi:F-type H+-transporting ATPase subunit epsilon
LKLRIFQPSRLFLETEATRVVAEGPDGGFGLLPRHIDVAVALVPGLLSYTSTAGEERFVALNGGILVKQGDVVSVATRMAIKGELGALKEAVERLLSEVDERERKTRSAVARLEADFVRRFVEFGKNV